MKRRLTGAVLIALLTTLLVAGAVPALAFDRSANEVTMLRLVIFCLGAAGCTRSGRSVRSTGRRSRTPGTSSSTTTSPIHRSAAPRWPRGRAAQAIP